MNQVIQNLKNMRRDGFN